MSKRDPFFGVVPDGLIMGGLGMCQGGVETGSYKGFAGFGKGIPRSFLIIPKVSWGGGYVGPKSSKFGPSPNTPKLFPEVPGGPQALPKIINHILGGPRAL